MSNEIRALSQWKAPLEACEVVLRPSNSDSPVEDCEAYQFLVAQYHLDKESGRRVGGLILCSANLHASKTTVSAVGSAVGSGDGEALDAEISPVCATNSAITAINEDVGVFAVEWLDYSNQRHQTRTEIESEDQDSQCQYYHFVAACTDGSIRCGRVVPRDGNGKDVIEFVQQSQMNRPLYISGIGDTDTGPEPDVDAMATSVHPFLLQHEKKEIVVIGSTYTNGNAALFIGTPTPCTQHIEKMGNNPSGSGCGGCQSHFHCLASWKAHSLEVWCIRILHVEIEGAKRDGEANEDGNNKTVTVTVTVLTGSDDSTWKMWRVVASMSMRNTEFLTSDCANSNDENKDDVASTCASAMCIQTQTGKNHMAGVTIIRASPCMNYVAFGSYDETISIWKIQKHQFDGDGDGEGDGLESCSQIDRLSLIHWKTIDVVGGVWRMKWIGHENESESQQEQEQPGKEGEGEGEKRKRNDHLSLICACMHGGCCLVDVMEGKVSAQYTLHESIAYGVDSRYSHIARANLVVSCSFYDNFVHLWVV